MDGVLSTDFEVVTSQRWLEFVETFKTLPWQESYIDQTATGMYENKGFDIQVDVDVKRKTPFGAANTQPTNSMFLKLHSGERNWSYASGDTEAATPSAAAVLVQFMDFMEDDDSRQFSSTDKEWLLEACRDFKWLSQNKWEAHDEFVTHLLHSAPLIHEMHMIQQGFQNGTHIIASRGMQAEYHGEPQLGRFVPRQEVWYLNIRHSERTFRFSSLSGNSLVIVPRVQQEFSQTGLTDQMQQRNDSWQQEQESIHKLGLDVLSEGKVRLLNRVLQEAIESGITTRKVL